MLFNKIGRIPYEDDYDYEPRDTTKRCKYCYKNGLKWILNKDKKWRLANIEDNKEHICERKEFTKKFSY